MAKDRFSNAISGKRSTYNQNECIIGLSDTSSEDAPIKKPAIQSINQMHAKHIKKSAFNPIQTSTPMALRTVNSHTIQRKVCCIRRSGRILHENATTTIVEPIVDLVPIEVEDEPILDVQVKVTLEKLAPELIQQKLHNINVADVLQSNTQNVRENALKVNYKTWQWQPKLKLDRLTENDLNGLLVNTSGRLVQPIKFDRDDSLIRELPPEMATKTFRQRIEAIRKSSQPHPVQGTRQVYYKEYEEVHKRVQKTSEKRVRNSGGRRLYDHGKLFENVYEDENSHQDYMETKTASKRTRT